MTVVEALRTILYESGIDVILDYPKMRGKLWDLSPAEFTERKRFQEVYDTGAAKNIKDAVMDAGEYSKHFVRAMETLCTADGMTVSIAEETLMLFYEAFGFPTKEDVLHTDTISEPDCEYVGEVRDGKRHGRGREVLYYKGEGYNTRNGLWLNDEPFGFMHSVDEYGTEEYCFCIKGKMIGKCTRITKDGEKYVDEY